MTKEELTIRVTGDVPIWVDVMLKEQKEKGLSVGKVLQIWAKAAKACFGNYASYSTTREDMLPLTLLKGIHFKLEQEGALTDARKEDLAKAFIIYEAELRRLAEKGDGHDGHDGERGEL